MTPHPDLAVVTGAFSYTGRYVTRRLLDQGVRVRTLTRSPDAENPFGGRVEVAPLDFSDPAGLRQSMQGAGVGRIVHFSVTNPSSESALPYFRGKAQVEDMLVGLGIPYAIIRPTLVFGVGDLLLNNMAWALRRFPVFPVYGNGDYPVQPVYVEDLAAQAVEAASQSESSVADAAGPDTLSFEALLRLLASSMDVRRWFPHTPPRVGLASTGLVGLLMLDMALTHDEVVGLMDGLLTSGEPPTGTTRLSDWLAENGDGLGRRYVSELRRNYRG